MSCSGFCWTARPRCCTTSRIAVGGCGTPWASSCAVDAPRLLSSGASPAIWAPPVALPPCALGAPVGLPLHRRWGRYGAAVST
eukprot:3000253-Heterocapsa_arctica.AAC.1